MKKVIILLSALILGVATSCDIFPTETLEPGETATISMAGEWYVTCDLIDANGEVFYSGADFFGLDERFLILTYNSAANRQNEIVVDDLENFWEFRVKCIADIESKTFSITSGEDYLNGDLVTLTGKIVENGTTTPSGQPADYIEITCTFASDVYPARYGYAGYRLSGWRNTGFVLDM